ncbi:enkurin [Drosophila tropicalis]|uniref:enkurin n=1 Tax=Drosophila tropicalis TaxID=46794 RepID=UPI0035AB8035
MSLVYITHHDESIFDVEREYAAQAATKQGGKFGHASKKATRFAQNLRDRLNVEYKKQSVIMQNDGVRLLTDAKKAFHRTMGCAHTPLDPPCAYLRKNQGVKWRRENTHMCPKGPGVPSLPRPGKDDGKCKVPPNFIRRNIQCAQRTVACPPPPRYVDTPTGTRHNLVNSGLLPQFICRKDFGKVPIYISKTKKMLTQMRAICDKEEARIQELCGGHKRGQQGRASGASAAAAAMFGGPPEMPGMRIMEQAERNEILEGLRQHLSENTKQYQSMSLLIDSVAKRQRKGKLESDLRQVEQDILLIETSPIIYVSQF